MKKIDIRHAGTALLVLTAVFIMLAKPFSADLSGSAHIMLGGILITLCIWVFKPFNLSYSMGGLFLGFFSLALGLKPAVVFSGFTQPAVWTLIPALFFGFVLQKTGLGKRVALAIMKLFKPTYLSLVLAWVLIGFALSVLTPSITVRVAIIIPIAVQCCQLCKLEKGSKGNSLILLTAFAMALIPGSGWLSGSLWGPIISGMINAVPEMEGLVTFNSWFSVLFLPSVIITVLLVAGSLIVLKPKEALSKDAIDMIKKEPVPKIIRQETIAALILVSVFIMFLTGSLHGLPDAVVCLAAVFAFFLFGVLEPKDFNAGVNWDIIIFMAIALSLGSIFTETGISQWFAGIIVPALAPIAQNSGSQWQPWVFVFGIMTFLFLWRFVDVAFFIPTMAIIVPVLPVIQEVYQISPLVWVAVFVMTANAFFMAYQNIWAMMTRSIAGDMGWENRHLGLYGVLYLVACLLALCVVIPVWINAGLFG